MWESTIYNKKNYKTREKNPADETVVIPVPAIIERQEFEEVQALLTARSPIVTPPRIVTGPVLLSGLAYCSKCGGAMTMSSGTSHNKKVYLYYSCIAFRKKGKLACSGRKISMPILDKLVVEHLMDRLLTAERVGEIISELSDRLAKKATERDKRSADLRKRLVDAEARLSRLYASIEQGIVELDDLLKEKVLSLQTERRQAQTALDRIHEANVAFEPASEEEIESFTQAMRDGVISGSIELRKSYIRSVVERIEIGIDSIEIIGAKADIERSVKSKNLPLPKVRSFIPKWHALGESNPSSQNENLVS